MEGEALINLLLGMGVPGVVLIVVSWLTKTYVPKALEAYKAAKEKEQESFRKRQEDYHEQSEKIVAVATASNIAIDRATLVMEENVKAAQAVVAGLASMEKTLSFIRENFAKHDDLTNDINLDIHKMLENIRRDSK